MADESISILSLSTTERANEGVEVELRHPTTGEPMGVFVRVLGADSDTHRDAQRAATDRRLELAARARQVGPNAAVERMTAKQIDDERELMLRACVVGWRAEGRFKMEPFSPEAVGELFARCRWAVEQLGRAVEDRALFFKG